MLFDRLNVQLEEGVLGNTGNVKLLSAEMFAAIILSAEGFGPHSFPVVNSIRNVSLLIHFPSI